MQCDKMKFISLFSGIGGFDLGLERAGMECIGQVEINPFCQKILSKHWPNVKRIGDIRDVNESSFNSAELICGGFPCQPFSVAGKRKGKEDDRYLWPEMLRVISLYKPTWIIGENVTGIISLELDNIISQLEGIGYEVQPIVIPACAADAPHRRDRVWILGYSSSKRLKGIGIPIQQRRSQQTDIDTNRPSKVLADTGRISKRIPVSRRNDERTYNQSSGCGEMVSDSNLSRLEREITEGIRSEQSRLFAECCQWPIEPQLGRVAHGIPNRVDRLKSLGNAVVPQIVELIGRHIIKIEFDLNR